MVAGNGRRGASHLFESSWKRPYSTRGVQAMLGRYAPARSFPGSGGPLRASSCFQGAALSRLELRLTASALVFIDCGGAQKHPDAGFVR
jgi:hypothetical protein